MSKMIEVTVEEFEANFDEYMDAIENGAQYIIRMPDGRGVAAVPVSEEISKYLDINPRIDYDDEVPGEPSY